MTTFNPISGGSDPSGSLIRNSPTGASAGGSVQPFAAKTATASRDLDVAQRLARKSADSVPQTRQLLESISSDVSLVESIQQAAGVLGSEAKRAPAFDVAAVGAALETIAFALQQGREFTEKLKADLPSLEKLQGLTAESLATSPNQFLSPLEQLQTESAQTRKRLAALAEELSSRNVRISSRASGAAGVDAVTAAMQSEAKRGLASVSMPPGGQAQVSSLLSDLGVERAASMRSATVPASSTAAVNTLIAKLQKQFPDSNG